MLALWVALLAGPCSVDLRDHPGVLELLQRLDFDVKVLVGVHDFHDVLASACFARYVRSTLSPLPNNTTFPPHLALGTVLHDSHEFARNLGHRLDSLGEFLAWLPTFSRFLSTWLLFPAFAGFFLSAFAAALAAFSTFSTSAAAAALAAFPTRFFPSAAGLAALFSAAGFAAAGFAGFPAAFPARFFTRRHDDFFFIYCKIFLIALVGFHSIVVVFVGTFLAFPHLHHALGVRQRFASVVGRTFSWLPAAGADDSLPARHVGLDVFGPLVQDFSVVHDVLEAQGSVQRLPRIHVQIEGLLGVIRFDGF